MTVPAEVLSRARALASRDRLVETVRLLHDVRSRAGDERALATTVAAWGRRILPSGDWQVDERGERSANLIATCPAADGPLEVLFYTHLDTSLSGDPRADYPLTGIAETRPELSRDGDALTGHGLAVSKAPAACALSAYAAFALACREHGVEHAPIGLLLSAGGTHRAPSGGFPAVIPEGLDSGLGVGVEDALRGGLRARAVINVKGGAPGVLREEPGCLLLRIEIRGPMVAVPARSDAPGAAVLAGRVADAVEGWRAEYAGKRSCAEREIAPDVGVGAIEGGLPYKPDLLPAVANVYVYVVTLPEESPDAIVAELERHVQGALRVQDPSWSPELLSVHVYGVQAGASTASDAPVVRAGRTQWEAAFGDGTSKVTGYSGSTDGVIFRRAGIDTVRMGVTARALDSDPTVERVSLEQMETVTGIYVGTLGELL